MQIFKSALCRTSLSKVCNSFFPLICFLFANYSHPVIGQKINDSVEFQGIKWVITKVKKDSITIKSSEEFFSTPRVVRYYAENDTTLYRDLRAGNTIHDAVIAYFDWGKLSHTIDSSGVQYEIIDGPISIAECYIFRESTGRPGEDLVGRRNGTLRIFERPVNFYTTIFRTRVILDNSVFRKTFRFYMSTFGDAINLSNSTFKDSVEMTMSNFKGLTLFENCTFEQYANFSGTDIASESNVILTSCDCEVSFKNCVFKKQTYFVKTYFGGSASFEKSTFEEIFLLGSGKEKIFDVGLIFHPKEAGHFKEVFSLKSVTFNAPTFLSENVFNELILDSAYFNHSAYFDNSSFKAISTANTLFRGKTTFFQCHFSPDISFETGSLFTDTLDVRGVRFDGDSALNNLSNPKFLSTAYLYNDLKLLVDDDIQKYRIGLEDLERVWIVADSKNKVERVRLYNNAIRYVNGLPNESTDLKNRVLQRLEYQISLTDLEFSSGLEHIWLWLVNLLTKNGYQGGGRFFTWVFIMITTFSIIYFIGFRKELEVFLVYGYFYKEADYSKHVHKNSKGMSPFIRAYAFSTNVFINPKFEFKYFKFSPKLQQVVVVEWCMGVAMFILFLVFIAAKYAFIQTLLGV